MSQCNRCGKWNGAHATLPGQPRDHLCHCPPHANSVKIPETADEAALMVLCGVSWLKDHAPERLKPEVVAPPVPEPYTQVVKALAGLLEQVEKYASVFGEADFETAEALRAVEAAVQFEATHTQPEAKPAQAEPVARDGWRIERRDETHLRLCHAGDSWLFSRDAKGTASGFIYPFLESLLAASPTQPK